MCPTIRTDLVEQKGTKRVAEKFSLILVKNAAKLKTQDVQAMFIAPIAACRCGAAPRWLEMMGE